MPFSLPSTTFNRQDIAGAIQSVPALIRPHAFEILPPFPVPNNAGQVADIGLANMPNANQNARWAIGSNPNTSNGELSEDTYSITAYGWEQTTDFRQANSLRHLLNIEEVNAAKSRDVVYSHFDRDSATDLLSTTTWPSSGTTGHTPGTKWDVEATSDPRADVQLAIEGIRARSGFIANAISIPFWAWMSLWATTAIRDNMKYVSMVETPDRTDAAARAAMARQLGLKYLFVRENVHNSAITGATPVVAENWSDDRALVFRMAETGRIEEPCLGRTLYYDGFGGLGNVLQYPKPPIGDGITFYMGVQAKVLKSTLGYVIADIKT